jgi:hypothetical protein
VLILRMIGQSVNQRLVSGHLCFREGSPHSHDPQVSAINANARNQISLKLFKDRRTPEGPIEPRFRDSQPGNVRESRGEPRGAKQYTDDGRRAKTNRAEV